MNLKRNILGFIAPEHCIINEKIIEDKKNPLPLISDEFFDSLPYAPPPDIIYNKLAVNFPGDKLYIANADALLSLKEDERVLEILHHIKYYSKRRLGYEFGKITGKRLKEDGFTEYDLIIPVPVHHIRKRERGYNQAEIIAKGVSEILGIPLMPKLIKRHKFSHSQTKLTKEERTKNVASTFSLIHPDVIKSRRILIIDDILTTGSTLNSVAKELITNNARSVDAASLAVAK